VLCTQLRIIAFVTMTEPVFVNDETRPAVSEPDEMDVDESHALPKDTSSSGNRFASRLAFFCALFAASRL
jgi:hypothetical protein